MRERKQAIKYKEGAISLCYERKNFFPKTNKWRILKNSAWAYSVKCIQGGKLSLQVLLENLWVLLEIKIIILVGKYELFENGIQIILGRYIYLFDLAITFHDLFRHIYLSLISYVKNGKEGDLGAF